VIFWLSFAPAAFTQRSWPGLVEQQPLHNTESGSYSPFTGSIFDDFVNATMAESLTPGMSVAIIQGNKTWAKGYGFAALESSELVTPHTLFYTGSTTKSFTTAIMGKLVESSEGDYANIHWSTKMVDLIRDDFVLQDEYATTHISLIDALSHRTGVPRHDLMMINGDPTTKEYVRRLRLLPMHRELREQWEVG